MSIASMMNAKMNAGHLSTMADEIGHDAFRDVMWKHRNENYTIREAIRRVAPSDGANGGIAATVESALA